MIDHPAFCPRCGTTTTAPRDGNQDCAECGQPVTVAMYASPADWRAKKITPEEGLRRLREIVGDSLDGVSIREALGRDEMADEIARLREEIADLRGTDPYRADRIDMDDDGELDDVAIAATRFRLERMSLGAWWLSVTRPDGSRFVVNLGTKRTTMTAILAAHYTEPK